MEKKEQEQQEQQEQKDKKTEKTEFQEVIIEYTTDFEWKEYSASAVKGSEVLTDVIRNVLIEVPKKEPQSPLIEVPKKELQSPYGPGDLKELFEKKDIEMFKEIIAKKLDMSANSPLLDSFLKAPGVAAIAEAPFRHIANDLMGHVDNNPFFVQLCENTTSSDNCTVLQKISDNELRATHRTKARFARCSSDGDCNLLYENQITLSVSEEQDRKQVFNRAIVVTLFWSEDLLNKILAFPGVEKCLNLSSSSRQALTKKDIIEKVSSFVKHSIQKEGFLKLPKVTLTDHLEGLKECLQKLQENYSNKNFDFPAFSESLIELHHAVEDINELAKNGKAKNKTANLPAIQRVTALLVDMVKGNGIIDDDKRRKCLTRLEVIDENCQALQQFLKSNFNGLVTKINQCMGAEESKTNDSDGLINVELKGDGKHEQKPREKPTLAYLEKLGKSWGGRLYKLNPHQRQVAIEYINQMLRNPNNAPNLGFFNKGLPKSQSAPDMTIFIKSMSHRLKPRR